MGFTDVLARLDSSEREIREVFSDARGERLVHNRAKRMPNYIGKLAEAAKFISDIKDGRRNPYLFREVMTTSDFPLLFGDILDRQTLAAYEQWPDSWSGIAKRTVVSDFRDVRLSKGLLGAETELDEVEEAEEYPDASLTEQSPTTYHISKFGRTVPFSWETQINDQLNDLMDIPERLGKAARRTENRHITRRYVGASGPNTTLYHNDYGNIINSANGASVNNPPLAITGLQDAFKVLGKMTDENGEPIYRETVTLVVPPALEITARNILNATSVNATRLVAGGQPGADTDGYQELQIANWMRDRVTLVVNPYIPIVASSANGNTSWFLFANPGYSREALRISFLRGHETPEMWMKSPDAIRIGGGLADAFDGDFLTDSIVYKVRHVFGTVQVDPKATVMSNGSGS